LIFHVVREKRMAMVYQCNRKKTRLIPRECRGPHLETDSLDEVRV
jgi:hypothetical protein